MKEGKRKYSPVLCAGGPLAAAGGAARLMAPSSVSMATKLLEMPNNALS